MVQSPTSYPLAWRAAAAKSFINIFPNLVHVCLKALRGKLDIALETSRCRLRFSEKPSKHRHRIAAIRLMSPLYDFLVPVLPDRRS